MARGYRQPCFPTTAHQPPASQPSYEHARSAKRLGRGFGEGQAASSTEGLQSARGSSSIGGTNSEEASMMNDASTPIGQPAAVNPPGKLAYATPTTAPWWRAGAPSLSTATSASRPRAAGRSAPR